MATHPLKKPNEVTLPLLQRLIHENTEPFIQVYSTNFVLANIPHVSRARVTTQFALSPQHWADLRNALAQRKAEDPQFPLQVRIACFRSSSGGFKLEWPYSVTLSLNGRAIVCKQGTYNLTPYVTQEKNRIDINLNSVYTYTIIVFLAREYSATNLANLTMQRKLIPKEAILEKLKKSFRGPGGSQVEEEDEELLSDRLLITLRDPLSRQRIRIPAKGDTCQHSGCFDLTTYLQFNASSRKWKCPICQQNVPFRALEVDGFMREAISTLPTTVVDIYVNADGSFVPTTQATSDDESEAMEVYEIEDTMAEVPPFDPTMDYAAEEKRILQETSELSEEAITLQKEVTDLRTAVQKLVVLKREGQLPQMSVEPLQPVSGSLMSTSPVISMTQHTASTTSSHHHHQQHQQQQQQLPPFTATPQSQMAAPRSNGAALAGSSLHLTPQQLYAQSNTPQRPQSQPPLQQQQQQQQQQGPHAMARTSSQSVPLQTSPQLQREASLPVSNTTTSAPTTTMGDAAIVNDIASLAQQIVNQVEAQRALNPPPPPPPPAVSDVQPMDISTTTSVPGHRLMRVTCPVCSKEMPVGMADKDIDAHIDECLVRMELQRMGPEWQ